MKLKRAWQLRHTVVLSVMVLAAIIGAFMLLMGNASAQASVSGQGRLSVHKDYYSDLNSKGLHYYDPQYNTPNGNLTPTPGITPTAPQITPSPTPTNIATGTPMPTCGLYWRVQSSPNINSYIHYLTGVAAVSANDVWAVGYHDTLSGDQTLTMHYTNGEWTVVPSPNPGTRDNVLYGVAAVSSDDVWAVGYYLNGPRSETLTMHYTNGEWTVVPSPNPGTSQSTNHLYGVAAVSANDVWAVGGYNNGGRGQTLTMHYTNGEWTIVPSPNPGPYLSSNVLYGVAVVSSDDVWAVGHYIYYGIYKTITLHYTGGEWTVVSSPNAVTEHSYLTAVAAVSADDVWAVGYGGYSNGVARQTLTMHYTNGQWTLIPSPNMGNNSELQGVTAVSANDLWAVGRSYEGDFGPDYTLTMHYTNGQWTVVPSPYVDRYSELHGVAAVSANDVWAVGDYRSNDGIYRTLTMHYSNPCVTPTPTSTATATTTSTNTPIPPSPTHTNTPLPTQIPGGPSATTAPSGTPVPSNTPVEPTPCTIVFTDVPPTDTFYPFIRCLACSGILAGYPCGEEGEPCDGRGNPYFRPNVSVTRGQIAKIVSNSAGYDEDPGAQVYEDVDPSNAFYQWINRLSMRGHMGGYLCGGEGEPCGVDDLPYFRPFADATRAQLAKIVSNAAGLVDTGAEQIFTDMLADNTFYVWIQRLASRGIMGGYACGGEGEPCDDANRPYFRPYNNVTRGQTSKIVAGAFFPNCQTP